MSLRAGSSARCGKIDPFEKRVPKNPRYAGVPGKVKTGPTVDKVSLMTTRQYLRRREEPYFRLTPGQLQELFVEYEQDSLEGVTDFRDHQDPDNHGPRIVQHESEAMPRYERPYLILDLRSPQDHDMSHIMQARSFEAKLLNQDRMTAELFSYKNREGYLIVLYENEERLACQAATTLIHRGFDNIFVLSGGLLGFAKAFPSYVEGDPPQPPPEPTATAWAKHSARRQGGHPPPTQARSARGTASTARSVESGTSSSLRGRTWTGGRSGAAAQGRGPVPAATLAPFGTAPPGMGGARAGGEGQNLRFHGKGGQSVDQSRASALSVADSIISRATSRRGRW